MLSSLVVTTLAFAPTRAPRATIRMVDEPSAPAEAEGAPAPTPLDDRIDFRTGQPPPRLIETMSVGGGTLAGDVGFDPLGLSDTPASLKWYREAEVKHCRLGMLAAAGWPLSELLNKPLSEGLGVDPLLDAEGRAPAALNGGLGSISLGYWVLILALGVAVEAKTLDMQLGKSSTARDYLPGMIGFDPLKGDGPGTRNAEIWLGRLGMLGITGFALEEALTGEAVVKVTPMFFQPIF